MKELADSFSTSDGTLVTINENKLSLNTNNELDLQIEQMIEKNEGMWNCKVCGKASADKRIIKRHAERHIKGVSHACHICRKIFSTRTNLQKHISDIHSELVCCDICGRLGMNRKAYSQHKCKSHNTLSVNL